MLKSQRGWKNLVFTRSLLTSNIACFVCISAWTWHSFFTITWWRTFLLHSCTINRTISQPSFGTFFYTSFWCQHTDINLTTTSPISVKPSAFIIYQKMIPLKYAQNQYENMWNIFTVNQLTKNEFSCWKFLQ